MNRQNFIDGLKAMGFQLEDRKDSFVVFSFKIPVGKLAGKQIRLGLELNGDAPLNPPTGPHVCPRLLPMNNTKAPHPVGGVYDSPLGPDWQRWSRPYENWRQGERSAQRYMAHINNLFATL